MGLLFVALIVSFVGLLFWAQRAGSQQQERFFQAVMSGDPSVLLALCDPALRDQIDAPVLAQWMGQVRKQLGDYKGLSSSDFSTSANTTEQGTLIQSEGTVHFQSGDAKSELEFLNNLLVKFSIESEKIPPGWLTGLDDTTLYQERGEDFIRKFFDRDAKGASDSMHEELRRTVSDDKLASMIDQVTSSAGPLKSIEFQESKFHAGDGEELVLSYRVNGENKPLDATVDFQFVGLKGVLMGFNFQEADLAGSGELE
jgi:hypothetical protein